MKTCIISYFCSSTQLKNVRFVQCIVLCQNHMKSEGGSACILSEGDSACILSEGGSACIFRQEGDLL